MNRCSTDSHDHFNSSLKVDYNRFPDAGAHPNELHYTSSSERSYEEHDGDIMSENGGEGSSRSSISSIPGSVLVHPRSDSVVHNGDDVSPNYSASGSGKRLKAAPFSSRARDRVSPFRNPSSVRAMQMNDDDSELDAFLSHSRTLKARRQRSVLRARSPCGSELSMPLHSGMVSPSSSRKYYRSSHGSTLQMIPQEEAKKDYPLVLLHCTLLPPSLLLPAALGTPSPELLKEVLPDIYWRRWKLLEEKVNGSDTLRDRGVLISHPQEAYDVLEERLLESLELILPRLAYGHLIESEDDGETKPENYLDELSQVVGSGNSAKCGDCGQEVFGNAHDERKWEVRFYAATGLMRAGAWAAAWMDMEKVDVEVGLWLPVSIKRELERRILEEEAFKENDQQGAIEQRKKQGEAIGQPPSPSQERDGFRLQTTFQQDNSVKNSRWRRSAWPSSSLQNGFASMPFQIRRLRSFDFRNLANAFTQRSLYDTAMTLLALVALVLAIVYSSAYNQSPSTSSPVPAVQVITVTSHHTLPIHTQTVFATSASVGEESISLTVSTPTIVVDSSSAISTPILVTSTEPPAADPSIVSTCLRANPTTSTNDGRQVEMTLLGLDLQHDDSTASALNINFKPAMEIGDSEIPLRKGDPVM